MLEYPVDDTEPVLQRSKVIVSDQDWWSFNSFLTVVLHNGLSFFATRGNSYPADRTWEQWQKELLIVIAKLKWLHDFDEISMDLYEWCLGKSTMELIDTPTKNKQCVFIHEKPENSYWYFEEASPALEARKKQIINEVFEWVKINFEDLWD